MFQHGRSIGTESSAQFKMRTSNSALFQPCRPQGVTSGVRSSAPHHPVILQREAVTKKSLHHGAEEAVAVRFTPREL